MLAEADRTMGYLSLGQSLPRHLIKIRNDIIVSDIRRSLGLIWPLMVTAFAGAPMPIISLNAAVEKYTNASVR